MVDASAFWLANPGGDFYNGVVETSVRLNKPDSAYLTRTPPSGATGNRKTWTWSGWLKRGTPATTGHNQTLFSAGTSTLFSALWIAKLNAPATINDNLVFYEYIESTGTDYGGVFAIKLRDHSAWYHVMVAIDTTLADADNVATSNRLKVYINGERITATTVDYGDLPSPSGDYLTQANTASIPNYIGRYANNNQYLDGYLAEVNFVDGLQLAPSNFGELKNGVWIPIEPVVSDYGTNGFRLAFNSSDFNEDGSAVTDPYGSGTDVPDDDVADASGSGNHFSVSGLVTSDFGIPDSPENNFPTMNPLKVPTSNLAALSEGSLKCVGPAPGTPTVLSTMSIPTSGKWYAEFRRTVAFNGVGIVKDSIVNLAVHAGVDANGYVYYDTGGAKYNNNSSASYGSAWSDGTIIGVAYNADDGELTFYQDNSSQGVAYSSLAGEFHFCWSDMGNNSTPAGVWNFGQDGSFAGGLTGTDVGDATDGNGFGLFKYAPPSGFLALCSANLPEPTIGSNSTTQADNYFGTLTYTGNGANSSATQDVTTGTSGVGGSIDFKPDFLWTKRRDSSAAPNLRDSSRDANGLKHLQSDDNGTEDTESDAGVTAFLDDGFRLKGTNAGTGQVNANNGTFVAWNWKANGGTTVTNEAGSIDSTVQANTTAGFSIVTWSGNETNSATIGHGLNSAPNIIITKCRSHATSWIYGIGQITGTVNDYFTLNTASAKANSSTFYQSYTSDSNTTFTVGVSSADEMNRNTGGTARTYVSYCFNSVEGYSRFGSYTGTGATSGTAGAYVYLGFRPSFVMLKSTGSGSWWMLDSTRDPVNEALRALQANEPDDEEAYSGNFLDFYSNGFAPRTSGAQVNGSGTTYIYMAFAEAPFKYANAR